MNLKENAIRWSALFLLIALLASSGFQISNELHSFRKKQLVQEELAIAAILHGPTQSAGTAAKFVKSFSDFCFFESSLCPEKADIFPATVPGFFRESGPQTGRLLVACISINAP